MPQRLKSIVLGCIFLTAAGVAVRNSSFYSSQDLFDYVQCQVCQTPNLTGGVQDSCCDYQTVDKAVDQHFHPILQKLTILPFFRYFKVNLQKQCPYWHEEGMCAMRECAVCECSEQEVPTTWFDKKADSTVNAPACDDQKGESDLNRVDLKNAKVGENLQGWKEGDSEELWIEQSDEEEGMMYVNLLENPERFTGYSGVSAQRMWNSIYKENCFEPPSGNGKNLEGMCFEERVYYRLISGMQSSINTHIALEYKFGENDWGMNTPLYVNRVGKHPEYLQNLYFTYLFVMRAVGKAKNLLLNYDYSTGNAEDDLYTKDLIHQLVLSNATSSCPKEGQAVLDGFDETTLFRVDTKGMSYDEVEIAKQQKHDLEIQFRSKFQNISRIMDCVTCEKCRLWGKIQVMGLGTAIKINLAEPGQLPDLQRNEVIALINVLTRFSESVDGIRVFRELEFKLLMKQATMAVGFVLGCCVLFLCAIRFRRKRLNAKKCKKE